MYHFLVKLLRLDSFKNYFESFFGTPQSATDLCRAYRVKMPNGLGLHGWNFTFDHDFTPYAYNNVKEWSALFQGWDAHGRCWKGNIVSFTTAMQVSSLSKLYTVIAQLCDESVGEEAWETPSAWLWSRGIYSSLKLLQTKFQNVSAKHWVTFGSFS